MIGAVHSDLEAPSLSDIRLTGSSIVSTELGTLEFQRPSSSPLRQSHAAGGRFYSRWREITPEQLGGDGFDPSRVEEVHSGEKQLAADLTVMPLIFATEYREADRRPAAA